MHYARDHGCTVIHGETRSEAKSHANPSLRVGLLRTGFRYVYDRSYFEPIRLAD
jgi:hypothetical protein